MARIVEELKELHFTLSNLEDYVRNSDLTFIDGKVEDILTIRTVMELIETIINKIK